MLVSTTSCCLTINARKERKTALWIWTEPHTVPSESTPSSARLLWAHTLHLTLNLSQYNKQKYLPHKQHWITSIQAPGSSITQQEPGEMACKAVSIACGMIASSTALYRLYKVYKRANPQQKSVRRKWTLKTCSILFYFKDCYHSWGNRHMFCDYVSIDTKIQTHWSWHRIHIWSSLV